MRIQDVNQNRRRAFKIQPKKSKLRGPFQRLKSGGLDTQNWLSLYHGFALCPSAKTPSLRIQNTATLGLPMPATEVIIPIWYILPPYYFGP
jgi:hypothetical protein